jgi:hypothetical protein
MCGTVGRRVREEVAQPNGMDRQALRDWGGRIAVTTDRLPRLHRTPDGLVSSIGCNGQGLALMHYRRRDRREVASQHAAGGLRTSVENPAAAVRFVMATGQRFPASSVRFVQMAGTLMPRCDLA